MTGVRQFDQGAVLDRAMETFWRRGYEATSIDDLVAATGVKRGSLYNAFGDKEGLFLAAFERYRQRVLTPIADALDRPDALAGIEAMVDTQLRIAAAADGPCGCLVVNTAMETAGRDDRLARRMREEMATVETAIYRALLWAQGDGALAAGLDLRALARFLAATLRTLSMTHRITGDLDACRDIAGTALSVLRSAHVAESLGGRGVVARADDVDRRSTIRGSRRAPRIFAVPPNLP